MNISAAFKKIDQGITSQALSITNLKIYTPCECQIKNYNTLHAKYTKHAAYMPSVDSA